MQKWCSKLRSLALISPTTTKASTFSPFHGFFNLHHPFSTFPSHFNGPTSSFMLPRSGSHLSIFPPTFVQVRDFSAISKEKKWKKLTPATSRVKKIKLKGYSSFEGRFRTLNDGIIRRWREGKRHNAHLKSKKAKRRLRKPEIVPLAYAKVMKKLNFCSNY